MNQSLPLGNAPLSAYEKIFQHPVAPDLAWHDVRSLLAQLGQIAMDPHGNLRVTRNGHALVLHPPCTHQVAETREFKEVRDFLERSGKPLPDAEGMEPHWPAVINL